MSSPINCRFCQSWVHRPDLITVQRCQRCDHENIHLEIQTVSLWTRWNFRRTLRVRRQQEDWAWVV